VTVARHPITGDPILTAHARAGRPNALGAVTESLCPFCPGHESETPPTIEQHGDPWRARVFANKYPAAPGHEVIVESPEHDATFDSLRDAAAVMQLSLQRYHTHRDAPHVALFKNHGPDAGASIPHLHSQLLPVPVVPPRIAREADAFERATDCPLCERPRPEQLIRETESFVWKTPSAAAFTHQSWIVPKEHAHEPAFNAAGELAELLQSASRAMLAIAPSYNWSFITFRDRPRAHWYIDLFPRLTTLAGFELGTGMYIEIVDPAETARRFRT
jgi:UDPglucose--hexose-1-phosphate uridylyltransferase